MASGATASQCGSTTVHGTLDKACTLGAATAPTKDECTLRVHSPTANCVSVNVNDAIYCIDSAGNSGTTNTICETAGTCGS